MNIKPIKTDNDYQRALARLELIFDSKTGSPEGDELDILGILIDKYKNEYFHIRNQIPLKHLNLGWSKWAILPPI